LHGHLLLVVEVAEEALGLAEALVVQDVEFALSTAALLVRSPRALSSGYFIRSRLLMK